jgi:hypothetical protein
MDMACYVWINERHGNGMGTACYVSINERHGHGMGTALARHVMSESALRARVDSLALISYRFRPPVVSSRFRKRDGSYEGFFYRISLKFITIHWPAYRVFQKVNSNRGSNTALWILIWMRPHRPVTKVAVYIYNNGTNECTYVVVYCTKTYGNTSHGMSDKVWIDHM